MGVGLGNWVSGDWGFRGLGQGFEGVCMAWASCGGCIRLAPRPHWARHPPPWPMVARPPFSMSHNAADTHHASTPTTDPQTASRSR